jgi:hypothetical protein
MTSEDPNQGDGDQGPWLADRVYAALAFGSFCACNLPAGSTAQGTAGAPFFFDGQRWFYAKDPYVHDIDGNNISLWKSSFGGFATFKMVVKTDTLSLKLTNLLGPTYGPYIFPRAYTGPFNRVSMTMGNLIVSTGKVNYVDNVEVRNGRIEIPGETGACCISTGEGTGVCQVTAPQACDELDGAYMGASTTCGTNNDTCDFCPSDPNKKAAGVCGCGHPDTDADGDGVPDCVDDCPNTIPGATVGTDGCPPVIPGDFNRDGDVDPTDLVAFRTCTSGPAVPRSSECESKDFDKDSDVDQSDYGIFQRCFSGENIPADPNCAAD